MRCFKRKLEPPLRLGYGRPCSGKTRTAIATCESLLSKNWNVIYWHAEGKEDARPTEYGVANPDQLLQMQLITDLHFSPDDLLNRIQRPTEIIDPKGTLVVIDTLDLFDCIPDDFFPFIESFDENKTLHFLILTQIPRYLERKTRDHAEEFVRSAYPTTLQHQIIVLGKFPDEC
ncbi:MAG: hypothetical protein SGJ18_07600 [Pseudomonadota bacterium]|nr:hypothetical protein [Pseudomonadota bacterium]